MELPLKWPFQIHWVIKERKRIITFYIDILIFVIILENLPNLLYLAVLWEFSKFLTPLLETFVENFSYLGQGLALGVHKSVSVWVKTFIFLYY